MVNHSLYKTSLHNLLRIYNSESESLKKSQFKTVNGQTVKNLEELLTTLENLELIETDKDPEIYFLSPETYTLIESDELDEFLLDAFNLDYEEIEEKPAHFNYKLIEPEIKRSNSPYLSKLPKPFIAVIFLSIIYLLYLLSPFNHQKPASDNISPEVLDALKGVIIIEAGDTLNLNEKKELMEQ